MEQNVLKQRVDHYLELEQYQEFKTDILEELRAENYEALEDRFYKELDFGTGGLRGVIGGGTNRMNPYTVAKATQGLANYINAEVPQAEWLVCIAFDSRNYSDLFAETAARVLASSGIKVQLFDSLRPTPELSFAVRQQGACAGIMVTASHNPAKYNGYKVFWSDGAQVTPPHDKGIIEEVRKVQELSELLSFEDAKTKGLIRIIGSEVDDPYIEMVKSLAIRPELLQEKGKDLKVVYTPLHGAGRMPVERALSEMGLSVFTVPEQAEPDGNFPTVDFPNPEIAPAMDLALQYAKKRGADLVMGTDPDSDRLGIAVPKGDQWLLISGNQLGALLADYIFASRKEEGTLPADPAFINTIVTTELQTRIAQSYGAKTFKVLTGFKYIGGLIAEFEKKGGPEYLFGGEESYGFLVGTQVRDKDAVSAATMTVEMALWNIAQGRTVLDHLEELYSRFGYFQETLLSRDFEGQQGAAVMDKLMKELRENPPSSFGALELEALLDYDNGTTTQADSGRVEENIDLPRSNVLQFLMKDGSLVTVRPSGTEPKIKFYASCCVNEFSNLEAARNETSAKIRGIEETVEALIQRIAKG